MVKRGRLSFLLPLRFLPRKRNRVLAHLVQNIQKDLDHTNHRAETVYGKLVQSLDIYYWKGTSLDIS